VGTQPIAMFQRANAEPVNGASLPTHCGQIEVFLLLFAKYRRSTSPTSAGADRRNSRQANTVSEGTACEPLALS
jgi:hypothetical protein